MLFSTEVKRQAMNRSGGRCEAWVESATYRGRCRRTFKRHGIWVAYPAEPTRPLTIDNCQLLCLECFSIHRAGSLPQVQA
jgi:hypothetical protein